MILQLILLIVFASSAILSAYEAGQTKQGKQIVRDYNYLIFNTISDIIFLIAVYFVWNI